MSKIAEPSHSGSASVAPSASETVFVKCAEEHAVKSAVVPAPTVNGAMPVNAPPTAYSYLPPPMTETGTAAFCVSAAVCDTTDAEPSFAEVRKTTPVTRELPATHVTGIVIASGPSSGPMVAPSSSTEPLPEMRSVLSVPFQRMRMTPVADAVSQSATPSTRRNMPVPALNAGVLSAAPAWTIA